MEKIGDAVGSEEAVVTLEPWVGEACEIGLAIRAWRAPCPGLSRGRTARGCEEACPLGGEEPQPLAVATRSGHAPGCTPLSLKLCKSWPASNTISGKERGEGGNPPLSGCPDEPGTRQREGVGRGEGASEPLGCATPGRVGNLARTGG